MRASTTSTAHRACVLLLYAVGAAVTTGHAGAVEGHLRCGGSVGGSTEFDGRSNDNDGPNMTRAIGYRSNEHLFGLQVDGSSGTRLIFDTCSSSFDTVVRVFDAELATELAICDDDDLVMPDAGWTCSPGCPDETRARLSVSLEPGAYVVVLEGYDTDEGEYVLVLDCQTEDSGDASPVPTVTVAATTAGQTAPVNTGAGDGDDDEIALRCGSGCYSWNRHAYSGQQCPVPTLSACGCGRSDAECEPCSWPCPVNATAPAPLVGHLSCNTVVVGDTRGSGASHVYGQASNEHHYRLTVLEPTTYTLSTCDGSSYDTWLRVVDGANYSNEVAQCDDGSAPAGASWSCGPRCGLQSRLTVALAPGAYVVVVEGYDSATGGYTLASTCETTGTTVSPVPVESIESSLFCGGTAHGSTAVPGLTSVVGEPSNEHIFGLEVTGRATAYVFDTCGSSFDTVVRIYDAGFTAELAVCDDDEPTRHGNWTCGAGTGTGTCARGVGHQDHRAQARLSVVLDPGSYRVVLEGFYMGTGAYVLSTTCPDPDVSVSHDRQCAAECFSWNRRSWSGRGCSDSPTFSECGCDANCEPCHLRDCPVDPLAPSPRQGGVTCGSIAEGSTVSGAHMLGQQSK